MKSLLMTLMMLIVSTAAYASDFNIDGIWSGVVQGDTTLTFEFKAKGKKLYGRTMHKGDSNTEIEKGKIKKDKISFEVPQNNIGCQRRSMFYQGKILNDNEIELTYRMKTKGPRKPGFGEGGGAGFDTGFSGGLGGFGGASQESTPFILKREEKK